VVLKIEASGFEVWSSWDLVVGNSNVKARNAINFFFLQMVTNASLILLQAWAVGAADQEDLNLIQNHLNMLTCTQQTAPSLRHTLATRLETALQQVRTPVRANVKLPLSSPAQSTSEIVNRWSYPALLGSNSVGSSGSGPSPLGAPPGMGGGPRGSHRNSHNNGSGGGRGGGEMKAPNSGFLFMDQAPDLGVLPDLPTFEMAADPSIADWPPFLLNLFGEADPNVVAQQVQGGPP
jgi:hypothetical protein